MKIIPLRDDPSAPRLVRADLARASKLPAVAFDTARGLASLEAAIQAGAAPTSPLGASAAGKSLAGVVVKGALLGLCAVGVAGVSSVELDRRDTPPSALTASAPIASPPAPPANAAPETPPATTEDAPPSPAPPRLAAPRPSVRVADPAPASTAAAPTASASATAPPAPSGDDPLQREMENLARVRALETSDPAQALALAEEGRRSFPGGVYAQEREAMAISSLVRLGRRGEAEARARAFVAAYPKSHLAEKMRALLDAPTKQ